MSKMRGATAIVGIGQTPYYKRGTSPHSEVHLCLRAIVAACDDAGIHPSEIDGFVSYASERSDAQKLMPGLGAKEMRFSVLTWGHGGGIPGALGVAAGAIVSGQADVVVVYRSMVESSNQRLRVAVAQNDTAAQYLVNGVDGPAQYLALRAQRLMEHEGVPRSAMKALAEASYHHARNNPRAYGRNTAFDDDAYDNARWIVEPIRLLDCSRENDAACAVILVSAERAKYLKQKPAYILSAPMGAPLGGGALEENFTAYYATAGQQRVAARMWAEISAGVPAAT